MTKENSLKKKIEKNIEKSKSFPQFYQYNYRIYFLNSYGVIVSLPSKEFLSKLSSLEEYFKDREEPQRKRLIRENLSMFASPIEDKIYDKKIELVSNPTAWVQTWKISNYPPSEDYSSPTRKELESIRGETLEEEHRNLWNSAYERTRWLTEFAKKVRDKLRKEMQ